MKPVTIKYYPLPFLNLAFTAKGAQPESWEELTPRQIIAIASTLTKSVSDTAFLAVLTNVPERIIKRLDNFHRFKLSEALSFFNVQKLHNAFAIPFVTVGLTKYYTPKPKLKGMSFGQFIFTDTYFGAYRHKNNTSDLHKFLAALCVQNRKSFSEDDIDKNAKQMAKLKPEVKEALVLNFMLVKAWLSKSYPLLFPEPENNDENQQPEAEVPDFDSTAWIKVFDSLVGDDLVRRDKYANLPVHTVFRYLSKRLKENIKRKK